MELFFVRHGQTIANKHFVHQGPETPLTELGRKQAKAVALRLKQLSPTRIISSPYTRATETAKIIGEELHLPVTTHESVVELKRPDYIYGHSHFGLRSLWYMVRWFSRYHNPNWRMYGGESYQEFVNRIHAAKEYLETFGDQERIVVVSHSVFINFFVEHICNERRMSLFEAALRLLKIITLDNSSLTHVEYHYSETPNLCTWHVIQFDDDTHVVK